MNVSSLVEPTDGVWLRVHIIVRFNLLMTSVEIRFFWLPLSTMKWSGVPFTHIYEWKRHSPSSGSSGSSGWTFVVAMVTLGSTSMIYFPLSSSESESESTSDSEDFISTTNDCLENIHQCCAKGFCGTHTTFQCPSSTSHYPSLLVAWTGCPGVGHPCSILCFGS
jgi:hypothetical protein